MIDTHCHLNYLKKNTFEEILTHCSKLGIKKIITITTDPDHLEEIIELSEKSENIYTTQGIHPHEAKLWEDALIARIKKNAQHKKVLAIGEIGLDYYYNNSEPDIQKTVFDRQVKIATELDLPIVIHTRDAEQDTIDILNPHLKKLKRKGVIHSFTASQKLADWALENNFFLGFNGIITFKKADDLRDVVINTPIENILLETDAPFLTPVPHRGKENAPFYLPHIAEKISELKKIPLEDVITQTTINAQKLFLFD
jgi:TatD DNase family protein